MKEEKHIKFKCQICGGTEYMVYNSTTGIIKYFCMTCQNNNEKPKRDVKDNPKPNSGSYLINNEPDVVSSIMSDNEFNKAYNDMMHPIKKK